MPLIKETKLKNLYFFDLYCGRKRVEKMNKNTIHKFVIFVSFNWAKSLLEKQVFSVRQANAIHSGYIIKP